MSEEVQKIQVQIAPILKEAGVLKSSIFGSWARGEARPDSDVDILIEARRPFGLIQLAALKRELEAALKKSVDVVEYAAIKPSFEKNILKDAAVIYEQR